MKKWAEIVQDLMQKSGDYIPNVNELLRLLEIYYPNEVKYRSHRVLKNYLSRGLRDI